MRSARGTRALCSRGVFFSLSYICPACGHRPPAPGAEASCAPLRLRFPLNREPAPAPAAPVRDERPGFPPRGAVAFPAKPSPCRQGAEMEARRSSPASPGPRAGWELPCAEGGLVWGALGWGLLQLCESQTTFIQKIWQVLCLLCSIFETCTKIPSSHLPIIKISAKYEVFVDLLQQISYSELAVDSAFRITLAGILNKTCQSSVSSVRS